MQECFVAAAALLVVGCSTPAQQTGTIADCVSGAFFADCGGSGEPSLACSDSQADCRWFSGRPVPVEFPLVSGCAATDICCVQGFPFGQEVLPPAGASYLDWALHGWGTEPWDAARAMHVAVELGDPALDTPFSCSGTDPLSGQSSSPCTGFTSTRAGRLLERDYIAVFPETTGVGGWRPFIEIDPASMKARVCVHPFTDVVHWSCPSEFTRARVVCATEGLITVSALTDSVGPVRGYVDATFDEFSMSGSFTATTEGP